MDSTQNFNDYPNQNINPLLCFNSNSYLNQNYKYLNQINQMNQMNQMNNNINYNMNNNNFMIYNSNNNNDNIIDLFHYIKEEKKIIKFINSDYKLYSIKIPISINKTDLYSIGDNYKSHPSFKIYIKL